jgi:hypothetical protein
VNRTIVADKFLMVVLEVGRSKNWFVKEMVYDGDTANECER